MRPFPFSRRRGKLNPRRILQIVPVALIAGALILGYYRWAIYVGTNFPPYHVAGSGYLWDDGLSKFFSHAFYLPAAWKIASNWLFTLPVLMLAAIALLVTPPGDPARHKAPWFFHLWFAGAVLVYFFAAREIKTNPWNFHIFSVPVAVMAGRGLFLIDRH